MRTTDHGHAAPDGAMARAAILAKDGPGSPPFLVGINARALDAPSMSYRGVAERPRFLGYEIAAPDQREPGADESERAAA